MARVALLVFGPLLIATGVLGFVLPANRAPTSGAPAYNVFHIAFGVLGTSLGLAGAHGPIVAFLIGFGVIDLYQAAASRFRWTPVRHFRWTRVDDLLHVVVGIALVAVGIAGA